MDKSKITITATEEQQKILNRRWDEAGIGNDYIFSCVMRNESTFLQLMQRIFPELKLSRVERHSPQMTFYGPYGTKAYGTMSIPKSTAAFSMWKCRWRAGRTKPGVPATISA